jgi:hypothetical protein
MTFYPNPTSTDKFSGIARWARPHGKWRAKAEYSGRVRTSTERESPDACMRMRRLIRDALVARTRSPTRTQVQT